MSDWMYAHSLPIDMHPEGCTCGGCGPEPDPAEECPQCHEMALYSKADAGYPELYHCANCRLWIDRIANTAWRIEYEQDNDND